MPAATDDAIELLRESHLGFVLLRVNGRAVAIVPRGDHLTAEAVHAADFRMALVGRDRADLERLTDAWTRAVPLLDRATERFAAGDAAAAAALAGDVLRACPSLLPALFDAPFPARACAEHQAALAMLQLAVNGFENAFVHLRECWLAAPRDPSFERLLLHGAAAVARILEANGRAADGRRLLATTIDDLHEGRGAIVRADHAPHVLWRHPEVMRRLRGVVQVGAHEGGEVDAFCRFGVRNQIYFEPVPEPFAVLAARVAALDPVRFTALASPIAISDRIGTRRFGRGLHTHDSSFLDLDPQRSTLHAQNRHTGWFDVETSTLDELARRGTFAIADHNLLFVDVQGTEHEVVLGAREVLARFDFVCLEVSYGPVYAGAWSPERLHELLAEHGFARIDEMATANSEQGDVLYERTRR